MSHIDFLRSNTARGLCAGKKCRSQQPRGTWAGVGYTTIETKGNFSRPIRANTGPVRAEARVASQGRQIISAEAHVLGPDRNVLAHGTTTEPVLGRCQTRALRLKRVHQPARRPYSRRSALAFAELKRECEDRRVAQERRRFRTLHPTLRNVSVSFYNCHLSNFGERYPSHKT